MDFSAASGSAARGGGDGKTCATLLVMFGLHLQRSGIVSDCLMWSSSDFPGSFSESIGISPIYRVGYLANGCELNAGS